MATLRAFAPCHFECVAVHVCVCVHVFVDFSVAVATWFSLYCCILVFTFGVLNLLVSCCNLCQSVFWGKPLSLSLCTKKLTLYKTITSTFANKLPLLSVPRQTADLPTCDPTSWLEEPVPETSRIARVQQRKAHNQPHQTVAQDARVRSGPAHTTAGSEPHNPHHSPGSSVP